VSGAWDLSHVKKLPACRPSSVTYSAQIGYTPCCVLPFCFIGLSISFIVLVFVVRWLGGSFAIFGFSVGSCENANVPPIALD